MNIKGKYNSATVYADIIDEASIEQIKDFLNERYMEDTKICIMPDVHAGKGAVIGTTIQLNGKVCPNMVGVDIGCGVLVVKLPIDYFGKEEFQKIENIINTRIPSGFNIHEKPLSNLKPIELNTLMCAQSLKSGEIERAYCSLGTLGGGNHFIEIAKNQYEEYYLIIHTGSRKLGLDVANYYQQLATLTCGMNIEKRNRVINDLTREGRQREIETELKKVQPEVSNLSLAFLEEDNYKKYLHDIEIVQNYASINRRIIAEEIFKGMNWEFNLTIDNCFETKHNYIDTNRGILRKGAVSAEAGRLLIIPLNMRDGSAICIGKGNPEWNYSAPHGAGRLMSRSKAKENIKMDDFKKSMGDILSNSIVPSTLDEAPMAYKNINSILPIIKPTVEVVDIIKPVYNFKAH